MRVALFGHGAMGRHHARHLHEMGVDLVVIDPALGMAGDVNGIDAAVIAVPTADHATTALPLLARGVPCLVEKPLAGIREEAAALAAFPNLYVGHVERFNPVMAVLAGAPRFVQADRVAEWTGRGVDVDVILDLMIHDLDLFLWRVAEPVVDVRANGVSVVSAGLDLAQARVETASGAVGTFTASRVSRRRARVWRAFGERAYWNLDLDLRAAVRVRWGEGGLEEERVPVAASDALRAELEAFLGAIHGNVDVRLATGAQALAALDLALAIQARICAS